MALTTFYGWSEADLLTELRRAQDDFVAGAAVSASGAGDVNTSLLVQRNAKERIQAIQQALYELDSSKYAAFALTGHNQTVGVFS